MKEIEKTATNNELVVIEDEKLETAFLEKNGLAALIDAIKKKAAEEKEKLPEDLSVASNRAKYKSLGAAVGRVKSRLEKTADALRDAKKAKFSEVQAEISMIISAKKEAAEELKQLRAEIAAPALEWEEAEETKKKTYRRYVDELKNFNADCEEMLSGQINDLLQKLEAIPIDDSFMEFQEEAEEARANSKKYLEMALKVALAREAETLRLAKQKRERDEAERVEREERIRREAAEKADANRRNRLAGMVERIKMFGATTQGTSAGQLENSLRIVQKEKYTKENFEEYLPEAVEARDAAIKFLSDALEIAQEREREEAEARKKKQEDDIRLAAENAAKEATRTANEKAAREQAEKEKADSERAADKAHRHAIDSEIIADMLALGMFTDEAAAAKFILHIKMLRIRHLRIEY